MFDNIALDIVIGLVFIYLLYSLFATTVAEMIATTIGLRARNLKEAVDRMLNDIEPQTKLGQFWDSLKLMKNPQNEIINKFYDQPEIKYLGSTGIFKNPSSFKAITFSKTLIYLLNGNQPIDKLLIDKTLKGGYIPEKKIVIQDQAYKEKDNATETTTQDQISKKTNTNKDTELKIGPYTFIYSIHKNRLVHEHDIHKFIYNAEYNKILGKESGEYILSMWNDSYGDVEKFRLLLETWFERTMEQTTEWYKRKIQIVLLILGFFIGWVFNADTMIIVQKLSRDKDAREKLVNMAISTSKANVSNQKNSPIVNNNSQLSEQAQKILEKNLADATSILGLGSWLPDTIQIIVKPNSQPKNVGTVYITQIEWNALPKDLADKIKKFKILSKDKVYPIYSEKLYYFFKMFQIHFFGFLITAIAISLGAPFWFDLLNKLVNLRTSVKQESSSPNYSNTVSRLNREA